MAVQLTWFVEGEKQLSRVLRGITLEMEDWKPALDKASRELKETFEGEVFETRGRAIQERWAALSGATLRQKARKGQPADPLVGTGQMQKSFTREVSATEAVISNPTPHFKYHQSKKLRKSNLPRRPMMKLGHVQRQQVARAFQEIFRSKINKHV